MRNLESVRNEINKIDEQIESLLTKRMELSHEVVQNKIITGGAIYIPEREKEILDNICAKAPNDVKEGYRSIWKSIIRTSRKRQYDSMIKNTKWTLGDVLKQGRKNIKPKIQKVAYCGNEGSYSWSAAHNMYTSSELIGCESFEKACKLVQQGKCDCVVLPFDNSTAGMVKQVYNLIAKYDFKIIEKSEVQINHVIVAKNDIDLSNIKKIYSHQQALLQCSEFIEKIGAEVYEMENTSFAAQYVNQNPDENIVAIASIDAAKLFGLKVVKTDIVNSGINCTRFISLSKENYISKTANVISVEISLEHKSGTLANVMEIVSGYGLNLSKIQSIPCDDKKWEFIFYMDIECSVVDDFYQAKTLLFQLQNELEYFRYLGWY